MTLWSYRHISLWRLSNLGYLLRLKLIHSAAHWPLGLLTRCKSWRHFKRGDHWILISSFLTISQRRCLRDGAFPLSCALIVFQDHVVVLFLNLGSIPFFIRGKSLSLLTEFLAVQNLFRLQSLILNQGFKNVGWDFDLAEWIHYLVDVFNLSCCDLWL